MFLSEDCTIIRFHTKNGKTICTKFSYCYEIELFGHFNHLNTLNVFNIYICLGSSYVPEECVIYHVPHFFQ